MKKYDTIIVGAGASGLYCACALEGKNNLIIEKGKRPGLKLLMAGSGQCNVTHGGSIKDFLVHYGDKGKSIRGVLQRYNNLSLCRMLSDFGVETVEREDGKVFPKSMDGRDVLNALLANANAQIIYEADVLSVSKKVDGGGYLVSTSKGDFDADNVVIAVGGASYPTTGSDGVLTHRICHDLDIELAPLRPSLTPVFVENYPYGDLSGISFKDVELAVCGHKMVDDLLFTFKNLSGPAIINSSRYMKAGDQLTINYLWPMGPGELTSKLKKDFPGNNKLLQNYLVDELRLPKRFAKLVSEMLMLDSSKVSQLTGAQIKAIVAELAAKRFVVSGLAGFREAMATAGGVALPEVSTKTMECSKYPGLYFIGEVLDIDGDTGGYNLQFAYSSAKAAAEHLNTKKRL